MPFPPGFPLSANRPALRSRHSQTRSPGLIWATRAGTRRAGTVLEQLGRQPRNSIPSAIGGWSETRSAYNRFGHDQVDAQKILEPHYHCTRERINQYPVVLVAQDTTERQTNPARTNSRDWERSTMKPGADSTFTPRWPSLRNDSHWGCLIPGVADSTFYGCRQRIDSLD